MYGWQRVSSVGYELVRVQPEKFWTVVLEKTLESPLDCKETHQSIQKEINTEYPLEGLMLKLKLQYFGHLMRRADSLEKTLMLWKMESQRRRGWQWMRWLDGIIDSMNKNLSKFQEIVEARGAWCAAGPWGRKESDMTYQMNNNNESLRPGSCTIS